MTECRHGFIEDQCATCADPSGRAGRAPLSGSSVGKTFSVVYAPTLRQDTFLHLNQEGDHWKFRWYRTPVDPPVELAQSAPSAGGSPDLSRITLVHAIAHPHSSTAEGVGVKDSRYWFEVIARTNAEYEARIPAIGRQAR